MEVTTAYNFVKNIKHVCNNFQSIDDLEDSGYLSENAAIDLRQEIIVNLFEYVESVEIDYDNKRFN